MSAFWGGFAGEGVKQLDKLREDNTVKLRIEDARKYQESRYALERADRKADTLEEWNADQKVKEATDIKGMYTTNGGNYMRTVMRRGADGNVTIDAEQVNDPGLIRQFLEYDAAKKQKAKDDEYDSEIKRNNLKQEQFATATMGEKWSLEKAGMDASRRASERSGRDKEDKIPMPDHVDAIGKSLAKNKSVYFRNAKDTAAFKALLKRYGFKNGADLGRRYERGEEKAILALDEGAEYLYFPDTDEIGDDGRLITQ
jgi:hypothetical protein